MTCRSLLIIEVEPGKRDEAIAAFIARGILSECGETISTYVDGRVWASETSPDRINVECDWSVAQGWYDWMESPVRAAQMKDIGHYVGSVVYSDVFTPVEID
jgi:heme-degrading monooxygenase HmoA